MRRAIFEKHSVVLLTVILAAGMAFGAGSSAKPANAAASQPSTTRDLGRIQTVRFSAPPPLEIVNEMKCDTAGDIYTIYSNDPSAAMDPRNAPDRLPIRKLSIDDQNVTMYAVPAIPGYVEVSRPDFDVDAQGRVYALLAAYPGRSMHGWRVPVDYFIARYDSSGNMTSSVKVGDIPGKPIEPLRLGVFADGDFLLAGVALEGAQTGPFAAIFDSSGQFVSELPVPPDITPMPYGKPGPPPSAAEIQALRAKAAALARSTTHPVPTPLAVSYTRVVSAADGNVYLLWGTRPQDLYVVSPDGSVIRQFRVPAPAPGMTALHFAADGPGHIFFDFGPGAGLASTNNTHPHRIAVLDPATSQTLATYRLAQGEDSRALAACAATADSFWFVRASEDSKNPVALRYSPSSN